MENDRFVTYTMHLHYRTLLVAVSLPCNVANMWLIQATWNTYWSSEAFVEVRDVPLKRCIEECQVRDRCKAMNYWRVRRNCELMDNDVTALLVTPPDGQPCLALSKNNMSEAKCNDCSQVCGPKSDRDACFVKECFAPPVVDNGRFLGTMMNVGARRKLVCDKWHNPAEGVDGLKCLDDGRWGPPVNCVPVSCGLPPVSEHGTFGANRTYVVNDTLELTCDVNYTRSTAFVDEASITCQEDRKWSVSSAYCVESCPSSGTSFMLSFFKLKYGDPYLYVVATQQTLVRVKTSNIDVDGTINVVSYVKIPLSKLLNVENNDVSNKTIHVTTDKPVHLFLYHYEVKSAEGTIIMPERCASKDYILISHDTGGKGYSSESVVVALQDDTSVSVTEHETSLTRTAVLNRYDVLHHSAVDLTGTTVNASNKVIVIGGHGCANVPNMTCKWCDYIIEQMPPLSSLCRAYVVTHQMPRPDFSVRVVASQNGTDVRVWNVAGGLLKKVSLDKLESHFDTFFNFTTVSITANKPMLVAQYSHGGTCDDVGGDPAYVVIPGLTQFLAEYSLVIEPKLFPKNSFSVVIREDDDISGLRLNDEALTSSSLTTMTVPGVGLYNVLHEDLSAFEKASRVQLTHTKGAVKFGVVQYGYIFSSKARAGYALVPGRNTLAYQ